MPNTVDYRLAKYRVIRRVETGELSRALVCDAHPELMRASRHLGNPTNRPCPICRLPHTTLSNRTALRVDEAAKDTPRVVETTWLFGDALRQKSGHLVEDSADLSTYTHRYTSFTAWTVECCVICGWNHVVARQLFGMTPTPAGNPSRSSTGLKVVSHG